MELLCLILASPILMMLPPVQMFMRTLFLDGHTMLMGG